MTTYYFCSRNRCLLHRDGFKPNPEQCGDCRAFCQYTPPFESYHTIAPDCPFYNSLGDCPDRRAVGCDGCFHYIYIDSKEKEDRINQEIEYYQGGE